MDVFAHAASSLSFHVFAFFTWTQKLRTPSRSDMFFGTAVLTAILLLSAGLYSSSIVTGKTVILDPVALEQMWRTAVKFVQFIRRKMSFNPFYIESLGVEGEKLNSVNPDYGVFIGELSNLSDGEIKGKVYAVNETSLQIIDFNYNGNAPGWSAVHFIGWLGHTPCSLCLYLAICGSCKCDREDSLAARLWPCLRSCLSAYQQQVLWAL